MQIQQQSLLKSAEGEEDSICGRFPGPQPVAITYLHVICSVAQQVQLHSSHSRIYNNLYFTCEFFDVSLHNVTSSSSTRKLASRLCFSRILTWDGCQIFPGILHQMCIKARNCIRDLLPFGAGLRGLGDIIKECISS